MNIFKLLARNKKNAQNENNFSLLLTERLVRNHMLLWLSELVCTVINYSRQLKLFLIATTYQTLTTCKAFLHSLI